MAVAEKKQPLGSMLVHGGYITIDQAKAAMQEQKKTGKRFGDIVVENGWISQKELMKVLELQHKVEYVDLAVIKVDPELVQLMTMDVARKNHCAPIKFEDGQLFVAMEDPRDFRVLDEVRRATRKKITPLLASGQSITAYLERLYGNISAQKALTEFSKEIRYEESAGDSGFDAVANAPIVKLVDAWVTQAINSRASDIHIEPMPDTVRVRMRVDGVLTQVMETPLTTLSAIISRIKVLSGLNIAERRIPQDGRFNVTLGGREVDLRVSTLPAVFGEKAVLRLLDRSTFLIPKEQLGFTEANLAKFETLARMPNGIILVTGPTGSGKTTTLYTMLAEMNDIARNIVTVEDPVEYLMKGITQTQVNSKANVTFASGLRAILRQDPDIIMIGEIRDTETVDIAIRAAVTGHLVLSTIHTNDVVSTIFRLIDMGIPNYMIAASLSGIIAQRLVRVICKECKKRYKPSLADLREVGLSKQEASEIHFYKGAGCPDCNNTGFKGRMAVHEFLLFDSTFRGMVHNNEPLGKLRKYVTTQGTVSLQKAALEIVKAGHTSLSEIMGLPGDEKEGGGEI